LIRTEELFKNESFPTPAGRSHIAHATASDIHAGKILQEGLA